MKHFLCEGGFDGYPVTTCEMLDVRMNKWQKIADLQLSRYGMGAAVINDKIYAVGGFVVCMFMCIKVVYFMLTYKHFL